MPSLCEKCRGRFSYATAEYRWFDLPWRIGPAPRRITRFIWLVYFVSQLLGNGLALTLFNLRRYGFVRLSSKQQRESFSFGREGLSIVGVALTLSGLGVYAYAIPALS